MKMNKEAINEITNLLEEVKDVVKLLDEFTICITSDSWKATSFCNKENILNWEKSDFEKLNNLNVGDKFYIGGNVVTGLKLEYKGNLVTAPEELAEIQGETFISYLNSIMKSISLKHFTIELNEPYGLIDNEGWEHFISINAEIKESGLKEEKSYKEVIEEFKLNKLKLDINEARKITEKNEKKKRIIKNLINDTKKDLLKACQDGKRIITIKDRINPCDEPFLEVHEYYEKLGYTVRKHSNNNRYFITW